MINVDYFKINFILLFCFNKVWEKYELSILFKDNKD